MSNNKNHNSKITLFFFFLGCFGILLGAFAIKQGNQIEGWVTLILGALSIYSALNDKIT